MGSILWLMTRLQLRLPKGRPSSLRRLIRKPKPVLNNLPLQAKRRPDGLARERTTITKVTSLTPALVATVGAASFPT